MILSRQHLCLFLKGYQGENCDQSSGKLRITKHTIMFGLIILAGLLLSAIITVALIQMKRRGRFVTSKDSIIIGREKENVSQLL